MTKTFFLANQETDTNIVTETNNEFKKLEEDVKALGEIQRGIASQINKQGNMLDQADINAENAKENTVSAVKDLARSAKLQRQNHCFEIKWIAFASLAFVVGAFLIAKFIFLLPITSPILIGLAIAIVAFTFINLIVWKCAASYTKKTAEERSTLQGNSLFASAPVKQKHTKEDNNNVAKLKTHRECCGFNF